MITEPKEEEAQLKHNLKEQLVFWHLEINKIERQLMQTVFSYIYLEIQAYIYVGESFQSHNLGNIGVRKY